MKINLYPNKFQSSLTPQEDTIVEEYLKRENYVNNKFISPKKCTERVFNHLYLEQ